MNAFESLKKVINNMAQVKTFTATVTDEFGGTFPNALVAVYSFAEYSKRSGVAKSIDSILPTPNEYEIVSVFDKITYKANYWYGADKKQAGFKSRPLLVENGDNLEQLITVNLDSPAVAAVFESNMQHDDKILAAIEADFITRNQ